MKTQECPLTFPNEKFSPETVNTKFPQTKTYWKNTVEVPDQDFSMKCAAERTA
jgi:hypothetical protein